MSGVEWSYVSMREEVTAFTPCPPPHEPTGGHRRGKPQDCLYRATLEKLLGLQLQQPGRNGTHLLILHLNQLLCLSVWCWERQDRNGAFYPVVLSQLAREMERGSKSSHSWFRMTGFGVTTH